MVVALTEPPLKVETLVKRKLHCWSSDCGRHPDDRAVLMEVAGYGDVVIFKKCDRCGSMNIIDLRNGK